MMARARLFLLFLLVALTLALGNTAVSQGSPPEWNIGLPDAPKDFEDFYPRAIAIDSSGYPHIVYGKDHLYYSYTRGMGWYHIVVDPSSGVGEYASIALDSADKVHISYYDSSNQRLKYASNATGEWVTEVVDDTTVGGKWTAIAVDSSDTVHITYYDGTNNYLKYATGTLGSWSLDTVDDSGEAAGYIGLALDASNNVHISYYDGTHGALKYATGTLDSWTLDTVDDSGNVGKYSSIAIDSLGRASISYYDETNSNLKYAVRDPPNWYIDDMVDTTHTVSGHTSIAVDSTDTVHITYYDGTNGYLKYATVVGGLWDIQTVDDSGYVDGYTSIALDSADKVHISYYWGETQVMYVTNKDGPWSTPYMVAKKGGDLGTQELGSHNSIAVDSNGYVHISYRDDDNEYLKYITDSGGYWLADVVDEEGEGGHLGDVGYDSSIALDSSGKVHIAYAVTLYDPGAGGLPLFVGSIIRYATNATATGEWETTTIADSGTTPSIAVDSSDHVHISYFDTSVSELNPNLGYATNATGSWVTEVVDGPAVGRVQWDAEIAVDSAGRPHIAYCGGPGFSPAVMHATKDGGSWTVEVVDAYYKALEGLYLSIAADSSDHLHISYIGGTDGDLLYATNATPTGDWENSLVADLSLGFGINNSIAVDSSGKAHISYYDPFNGDLVYATTDLTGNWVSETVDGDGNVGSYNAIAVGPEPTEYLHISYSDDDSGDLKYATTGPLPGVTMAIVTVDGDYVSNDPSADNDIQVAVDDGFRNTDPNNPDTIAATETTVKNLDTAETIGLELVETGDNTGIFTGTFEVVESAPGPGQIQATLADRLRVTYISSEGPTVTATTPQGNTVMQVDGLGPAVLNRSPADGTISSDTTQTFQADLMDDFSGLGDESEVYANTRIVWDNYHSPPDSVTDLGGGTFRVSVTVSGLAQGTHYWWVETEDLLGNRTVSSVFSLTIGADVDDDGVADDEEQGPAGNNPNYDGNGDGTPDSQQDNVASMHTHDGADYVTLASPGGTNLSNVEAVDNPSPGDAPSGVEFPYGHFEFTIGGVGVGGATTVTLYLPSGASPTTYYKYGPTPGNPTPHWYEFLYDGQTGAQISGNVITLHFVDGERGDEDLTANGVIVEPGAPGQPPGAGDTEPPVLKLPGYMMVEATDASGAVVTYIATATDAVDGRVAVTCSPPPGTAFPIGMTTVQCSASDSSGNSITRPFVVDVIVPAEQIVPVSPPAGGVVEVVVPGEARRLSFPNGVGELYLPGGFLEQTVQVVLAVSPVGEVPPPPSGVSIRRAVSIEVFDHQGEPLTVVSGVSANLALYYDEEDLALAGGDPSRLVVMRYVEDRGKWVPLFTQMDAENQSLTVQLTTFSLFGVAVQSSPADVNGDGVVDFLDLARLAAAFGATSDEALYDARADLNNDSRIDVLDLAILAAGYQTGD